MSQSVGKQPNTIQNVFVLLLLAIFAVLSTLLVAMGAQLYRATIDREEDNNNARVLSAVVRSAVWAEDGGEVLVEHHDDISTLAIVDRYEDEDGEEEAYYKRLFCHDGYLWESYTSEERGFDFDAGESLCELAAFEPVIDGKTLTIQITALDGSQYEIRMSLRAGGAGQ